MKENLSGQIVLHTQDAQLTPPGRAQAAANIQHRIDADKLLQFIGSDNVLSWIQAYYSEVAEWRKTNKGYEGKKKSNRTIIWKNGTWIGTDFTDQDNRSGDIITLLRKKKKLTYPEAIKELAREYNYQQSAPTEPQTKPHKTNKHIHTYKVNHNRETHLMPNISATWELAENPHDYTGYGKKIDDEYLQKYGVFRVKWIKFTESKKRIYSTPHNPIFIIRGAGENIKIYIPKAKKGKKQFTASYSGNYCFGFEQLPERCKYIIITAGQNDTIAANMLLNHLDIFAICLWSESSSSYLHPELVKILQKRCEAVFMAYDDDDTGNQTAKELCDLYTLNALFVPHKFSVNDFCDALEIKSRESIIKVVQEEIHTHTHTNEADLVRERKFPLDVLPSSMQKLITENERISGFSRDYMATSMLTAIAAVCGNAYKIQLKKDWHEPAIIWACIVGNAGVAKSPALSVGMRPIIKLEKEYHQQWIDKLKEWENEKENLEKGKSIPPKPKRKNLLISDSTMEETIIIHSNNKNGLLKRDEELIGFFKSMDAYRGGKGADAQTWLNIFDNGLVKVNRVSRDPLFLPNACISVIGGIQPKILQQMAQNGREHNGFLARFIFAFPEHKRKEGWTSESVDFELHDKYEAIIRKIYNHTQSPTDVYKIEFISSSEKIWAEWKLKNDQYINTTKIEANAQFYSKLEKMCARLALVLNVAYWAAGEQDDLLTISDKAMKGGIELAEYYRYNAQKANIVIKKSSDSRLEVIEQLLLKGVSKLKIADELGVSRQPVYNLIKDNPWLKAIKKAKV